MWIGDISNLVRKNGTIALISDTHEGIISQSEETLQEALERCERKKSTIVLGGDLIEARRPSHPYYEKSMDEGKHKTIDDQIRGIAAKFRPFKKYIAAVMLGNHDRSHRETFDVSKKFTEYLGINRPCGMITLKAKIGDDRLFYFHPDKFTTNSKAGDAEQRYSNDVRKIRRFLYPLAGDCIVMAVAHIHKLRVGRPVQELALVGDDKDHQVYTTPDMYRDHVIPETQRYYCSTGGFMRTRMKDVISYSEGAGFSPTEMGYIEIQMHKGKVAEVREIKL